MIDNNLYKNIYDKDEYIKELEQKLVEKSEEIIVLQYKYDKKKKKYKAQKEELKAVKMELKTLSTHAENLENVITALKTSVSWKITGPVRLVVDLISGNSNKSK